MATWQIRADERSQVLWVEFAGDVLTVEESIQSAEAIARFFEDRSQWHLCGVLDDLKDFERDKSGAWNELFKDSRPQFLSVRVSTATTGIGSRLLRTAINLWGSFIRTPIRMYASRAEILASLSRDGIPFQL